MAVREEMLRLQDRYKKRMAEDLLKDSLRWFLSRNADDIIRIYGELGDNQEERVVTDKHFHTTKGLTITYTLNIRDKRSPIIKTTLRVHNYGSVADGEVFLEVHTPYTTLYEDANYLHSEEFDKMELDAEGLQFRENIYDLMVRIYGQMMRVLYK